MRNSVRNRLRAKIEEREKQQFQEALRDNSIITPENLLSRLESFEAKKEWAAFKAVYEVSKD